MINVMCIFIFVNWDTLVPWAYQLCCLPSINNTIQYNTIPAKVGIKSCTDVLENVSFVHVFGCMCMLELTITGWWIIVAYLSISNWFELQLVSQLASYLFSYFLLRSLLPFSNSKFFLTSCLFTFYRILWL